MPVCGPDKGIPLRVVAVEAKLIRTLFALRCEIASRRLLACAPTIASARSISRSASTAASASAGVWPQSLKTSSLDLIAEHPALSVDLRRPEHGGRIKRRRPDSTDAAASAKQIDLHAKTLRGPRSFLRLRLFDCLRPGRLPTVWEWASLRPTASHPAGRSVKQIRQGERRGRRAPR
jgi:hypothetical protein